MSYAAHFSRFLQQQPDSLYFAAHRLHPLPDASFDAQQQAWLAGAASPVALQQKIEATLLPQAFEHIARVLRLPQAHTLHWAAGADTLLTPLLDTAREHPLQILCADPLPLALAPTLRRLETLGRARLTRVPLEPFQGFEARWGVALRKARFDWICLSQCCSETAFVPTGLATLAQTAANAGAQVLIDGSHGFMALEMDLSTIADHVSYVAEAPAYAMSGAGYAFLYSSGPVIATNPPMPRFDPAALYRFIAAMDWIVLQTLTPAMIHGHAGSLQARFLSRLDALRLPLSRHALLPPLGGARGNFLCFSLRDATAAQQALSQCGVILEGDDERLRIGFDIHHTAADIDALLSRLAQGAGVKKYSSPA